MTHITVFIMMLGRVDLDAEELGQLRGGDDDGGGVGESVDHRVRQEIDHQSQSQHAQRQLDRTDHEGQQDRV